MQHDSEELGDEISHPLGEKGPSTRRVTGAGQPFTTHQQPDLRWKYRIDGKDSERTYPTAGEAERGALAQLVLLRKKQYDSWKILPVIAMVLAPVAYVLWLVYRLFISG